MNNKEVVKEIEDILDQTYLNEECRVDSLVRIDDEECYCRGCVYSYTATLCPRSIQTIMKTKVFR